MNAHSLPLWVTIPGTVLLVLGGLSTVIGALGLLRLNDFFARMHGPSMTNTVGAGSVLIVSMLTSSALLGRPSLHEVLIALAVFMSAPITSILLVQAALYRNRAREGAKTAADNDD
jgi:multicomponent K+:H+ antiporter subunit G